MRIAASSDARPDFDFHYALHFMFFWFMRFHFHPSFVLIAHSAEYANDNVKIGEKRHKSTFMVADESDPERFCEAITHCHICLTLIRIDNEFLPNNEFNK